MCGVTVRLLCVCKAGLKVMDVWKRRNIREQGVPRIGWQVDGGFMAG